MLKSKQGSLLDEIERQTILEAKSEDFEEEMDRIKNLPEKDWLKLFKISNETYS